MVDPNRSKLYSQPEDMPSPEAVFTAEGVYVRLEEGGLAYGPLDLTLQAGQGALVTVDDLSILRRLMKCCLGYEKPQAGRLVWLGDAWAEASPYWGRYDFYRSIGYVDRESQLINSLSLLDNFLLLHRYASDTDDHEQVRDILQQFGLEKYESMRAEALPEPKRRLALYALAFNQNPRLMLMERPMEFLDRDFNQVWDVVLWRAVKEGMAFIVFDRSEKDYSADHFSASLKFRPGAFSGF